MSPDASYLALIPVILIVGSVFLFPWMVIAWHLRLIKSSAWKWLLSFVLTCLALLVFTLSANYYSGETAGDVVAPLIALFILTGISTALIFPFVLRATILRKIDFLRGKQVLGSMGLFFATLCFFLYSTGFMGSTRARIALDHSFHLPDSASHIECEDFFTFTPFADVGAGASFEISRKDLNAILIQFPKISSTPVSSDNPSSRPNLPADFKKIIAEYSGVSRDGNVFSMEIYNIDATHVGIGIDTEWN